MRASCRNLSIRYPCIFTYNCACQICVMFHNTYLIIRNLTNRKRNRYTEIFIFTFKGMIFSYWKRFKIKAKIVHDWSRRTKYNFPIYLFEKLVPIRNNLIFFFIKINSIYDIDAVVNGCNFFKKIIKLKIAKYIDSNIFNLIWD